MHYKNISNRNESRVERQIASCACRGENSMCGFLSLEVGLALVIMAAIALSIGRYQVQIRITYVEALNRLRALQRASSCMEQLFHGRWGTVDELWKEEKEMTFLFESGTIFSTMPVLVATVKKKYQEPRQGSIALTTFIPQKK